MPVGDWQFWVVTAITLVVFIGIVRKFVGRRRPPSRSRRVELTIEKRRV